MQTRTIRQGQTEVGVISHEGRSFAALGSSVHGTSVTGYLGPGNHHGTLRLTRWDGSTMLECRGRTVETYRHEWHSPRAVVFSLTRGRYVVGYALEKSGGLFRGELVIADDEAEADQSARSEAEYWIDRDWEDEQSAEYDDEELDDDSE